MQHFLNWPASSRAVSTFTEISGCFQPGQAKVGPRPTPLIRSYRGTSLVWPDFQPMRAPQEPVGNEIFRQSPVFTSLHLKSPVHVVPPQSEKKDWDKCKEWGWGNIPPKKERGVLDNEDDSTKSLDLFQSDLSRNNNDISFCTAGPCPGGYSGPSQLDICLNNR